MLVVYSLAQDDDRLPERTLYLAPGLTAWIAGPLATANVPGRALSPAEQAADFMDPFRR